MNNLPSEFWIVVTQYDSHPDRELMDRWPSGPLVHEGYLLTEEQARERAKGLVGHYGWVSVLRVQVPSC